MFLGGSGNISTRASNISSPVERNIDRDGGGGEEVGDEVPLDDLRVGRAGLQEGGGLGPHTAIQLISVNTKAFITRKGFEGNRM